MNQYPNEHDPWEDELDQLVKRLPDRPAPQTLIPRVRAAIEARESAPWYSYRWSGWHGIPRAACLVLSAALVASSVYVLPALEVPPFVPEWASSFRTLVDALWTAYDALYTGGMRIALLGIAVLFFTTYLTCLSLGSAVYHVARRSES